MTLADEALTVAKWLGRVDANGTSITDLEAEIKDEIGEAIRFYNRKPWHLTEFRGVELTTAQGVTWYSTVDMTNGDGDQDNTGRSAVNVNDLLNLQYMRDEGSGLNSPMRELRMREFESFFEGSTAGGVPTYFTRYAGQIGIWPTPDAAYTLYFNANMKPVVPTDDADESVWFDQAGEMIRYAAAKRVCINYLRDRDRAMEFKAMQDAAQSGLISEMTRKNATGRIKPHD